MNSLRIQFNVHDIPKRPLTPYRLLGFIEGDGSFCITSMIPVLTVKQHSKNVHFLYEIAEYLNTIIPYNPEIGPKEDKLNTRPVGCISNSGLNTSILSVTNILQLYNYVLPFFKSLTFNIKRIYKKNVRASTSCISTFLIPSHCNTATRRNLV